MKRSCFKKWVTSTFEIIQALNVNPLLSESEIKQAQFVFDFHQFIDTSTNFIVKVVFWAGWQIK